MLAMSMPALVALLSVISEDLFELARDLCDVSDRGSQTDGRIGAGPGGLRGTFGPGTDPRLVSGSPTLVSGVVCGSSFTIGPGSNGGAGGGTDGSGGGGGMGELGSMLVEESVSGESLGGYCVAAAEDASVK